MPAGNEEDSTEALVTANGKAYDSLEAAFEAAEPDEGGVITYEINGKAEINGTGWVQILKAGLTNAKEVRFVGKTDDAEICITGGLAVLADQSNDIDVSFENLKLTKPNPAYGTDYGQGTNYFTTWLRDTGATENTVTYTNCKFPNGVCNNQYGKTVFSKCSFNNTAADFYNLWVYGGDVQVEGGTFTGTRGVKAYTEGTPEVIPTVKIENTKFEGLTEKAAVVVSKAAGVSFSGVSATNCEKGIFQKDIEGSTADQKVTIEANGSNIGGTFNVTNEKSADTAKSEFNITSGTFTSEVSSDYCADGFKVVKDANGEYAVEAVKVAEVNGVQFADLQSAINEAADGATVTLVADVNPDATLVVENKKIVLKLNKHTLANSTDIWDTAPNSWSLISVRKGGGLTIEGEGALKAKADDCYAIDVQDGGELTVNGGTYIGNMHAVYVHEGHATINGGAYSVQQKYPEIGKEDEFVLNCYDANRANGTASITVTGGSFDNYDPSNNVAEGAGTNFLPAGKGVNRGEDGSFTVAAGVAQVVDSNGKSVAVYEDFASAIENAEANGKVILLDNISDFGGMTVTKDLSVDFRDSTITGKKGALVLGVMNAKVTLDGKTGGINGGSGGDNIAIHAGEGSNVVVNGGNYTVGGDANGYGNSTVYVTGTGKVTINGGSFSSEKDYKGKYYVLNIQNKATGTFVVNGGSFTNFDPFQGDDNLGGNFVAEGSGVNRTIAEDGTKTFAVASGAAQVIDENGESVAVYSSLSSATETAEAGQTITLLKNVDISSSGIRVKSGQDITLDLNGHSIKAINFDSGNIMVSGTLTLRDNSDASKDGTGTGKIYTDTPYVNGKMDKPVVCVDSGGSFVMDSGLIDTASAIDNNEKQGQFAVGVYNATADASATINGGKIKAGWYAVAGNGQYAKYSGNITVNGGVLESTADYAIYHPQSGKTTINSGVVYGLVGAVCINRGELEITGGTVTSKGQGSTGNWGDGTGNLGKAAIYANAGYEDVMVRISGGTITADSDAVIITTNKDGHESDVQVSGGTFNKAVEKAYCADGYIPAYDETSGTYGVTIDTEDGWYDVSDYRSGETFTAPKAPSGEVFAGWYTNAENTNALDKTVTTGAAHAKFVEIADLLQFKGGSLRMDFKDEEGNPDCTKTSLRFGYEMHVPEGASLDRTNWGWTVKNPVSGASATVPATNYWTIDGNGAISNVVIEDVIGFETQYESIAHIAYTTTDGTYVEVAEQKAQVRSVRIVAESIEENAFASDAEKAYANGILATLKKQES